nr:hypothetical protein [Planctomycetota bacterium]
EERPLGEPVDLAPFGLVVAETEPDQWVVDGQVRVRARHVSAANLAGLLVCDTFTQNVDFIETSAADDRGVSLSVAAVQARVGRNRITISTGEMALDPLSYGVFVHDLQVPFHRAPEVDIDEHRVLIARLRDDLSPIEVSHRLRRVGAEIIGIDEIGAGETRDCRVWLLPEGDRDLEDVLDELGSEQVDVISEFEGPLVLDSGETTEFPIIPMLRKAKLPRIGPDRARGPNAGKSRSEVYFEARRLMREAYIKNVLPKVFGTEGNPGPGRQYYVIDARIDDDDYRFPHIEEGLGLPVASRTLRALDSRAPYDRVSDNAPTYRHRNQLGQAGYSITGYHFEGWDQECIGDLAQPTPGTEVNGRELRFKFSQSYGETIASLLKPRHKGVILVLHGYNNNSEIDVGEQPGQVVVGKNGRAWNPDGLFYGSHMVTRLWPQLQWLYRQGISNAGGKPDDYLILPVSWTGDYDAGLTAALYLNCDSAFAHDTGSRVMSQVIADIFDARNALEAEDNDLEDDGDSKRISGDFRIIIQGNSLGARVVVSTTAGAEVEFPLIKADGRLVPKDDSDVYPPVRCVLGHPALRQPDLADALMDKKQDDSKGGGDVLWPLSPLQEELRGVRFGGNRPLLFYSPYDKPGLSFRFAQRVPDEPIPDAGPKEPQFNKGPLVPMLGRVGLELEGYANTAGDSLVPIRGIHASKGEIYQDLWHVVLMGWNVPGQMFPSRHTYLGNEDSRGTFKSALVGGNLASYSRISLIEGGHIEPVWNRIGDYVVNGDPIP